ncbi:hypothetical protein [Dysgonomonas sp. HDW5B]|nr:hypothetical protein [Dysgonomonas sp. HDW5B]
MDKDSSAINGFLYEETAPNDGSKYFLISMLTVTVVNQKKNSK